MERSDLIKNIIDIFKYKTYLEIGCRNNETFDKIIIQNKIGVDPNSGGTHRMTSDEFFYQNNQNFDIIFIDGLHISDQVDKDICNSLKFLNKNGTVVLHDCNPPAENTQEQYMIRDEWCGDVWKSFVKQRQLEDIDAVVGDFDYGCGVLRIRKNSDKIIITENLNWQNLNINRNKWLRLMQFDDLINWII